MSNQFITPMGYLHLNSWQIHYCLAVTSKPTVAEAVNHFVVQCERYGLNAEQILNMMKEPPVYRVGSVKKE